MASSDPNKLLTKADKLTKLNFSRWSADWKTATVLYEQAAIGFVSAKNHEKAKLAFEKASQGQEMLASPWNAAEHMESAAALAKELSNWREVEDFCQKASQLYMECGRPQPASDALAKAARALEDTMPEEAIQLYTDACTILEDDNKEQMAFDLYRAVTRVYIKLEKYTDAASSQLRLGLAADQCNATNSQSKAYLSAIIVYLYAHDFPNTNLHFEQSHPTWKSLSLSSEQQHNQECFYTPSDQCVHQFDSALSSMVSSPAASNSNMSNENFVIRELIGKLGNIGNCSDEISHTLIVANSYINSNNNTSCYNTPLNSPPKLSIQNMSLNSTVAQFSTDPGFAERAAKFSCFGSKSFNGRTTTQLSQSQRSTPLIENGKLSRVSSSPSLKEFGSQSQENIHDPIEVNNSQEESTISENGNKPSPYVNSRKRKASSKGKTKENSTSSNPLMACEVGEDSNSKRMKTSEGEKVENGKVKAEEESKGGTNSNNEGDEKQNKSNSKPPEAQKDYIHVRARRGQATDSHSLAERVRREKISERMKLLQDLVPGCNKVTGKALMLDEIINYVQSLQRQVEFLSMKLASVNTRVDFSIERLISKDIFQSNNSLAHPIFSQDSSAPSFYGQQHQQNSAIHNNISNGTMPHNSLDPLENALCQNLGMHLSSLNGFHEAVSQYPLTFSEDDLHTIVQMGFGQTDNRKTPIQFQSLNGTNELPL